MSSWHQGDTLVTLKNGKLRQSRDHMCDDYFHYPILQRHLSQWGKNRYGWYKRIILSVIWSAKGSHFNSIASSIAKKGRSGAGCWTWVQEIQKRLVRSIEWTSGGLAAMDRQGALSLAGQSWQRRCCISRSHIFAWLRLDVDDRMLQHSNILRTPREKQLHEYPT